MADIDLRDLTTEQDFIDALNAVSDDDDGIEARRLRINISAQAERAGVTLPGAVDVPPAVGVVARFRDTNFPESPTPGAVPGGVGPHSPPRGAHDKHSAALTGPSLDRPLSPASLGGVIRTAEQ